MNHRSHLPALFSLLLLLYPFWNNGSVASELNYGGDLTDILFLQYRLVFSDLLGRSCVFEPSCSRYAQEAVGSKGPLIGIMTGLERWTRCHSGAYSRGDYHRGEDGKIMDPVEPEEEVTCWGRSLLSF